jgi:hypothetical protein
MITLLLLFMLFMFVGFLTALLTGLIAMSPIILLILCLPAIDYLLFRLIIRRKKK